MLGSRNWRAMRDTRRYRHHYPVGSSCRGCPPTLAARPGRSPPTLHPEKPSRQRVPSALLSDQVPCPALMAAPSPYCRVTGTAGRLSKLSTLTFKTRGQHQPVGPSTQGRTCGGPCWWHSCCPRPCPLHPGLRQPPGCLGVGWGADDGDLPALVHTREEGKVAVRGSSCPHLRGEGPRLGTGVLTSPQHLRGLCAQEQTPPPPGMF